MPNMPKEFESYVMGKTFEDVEKLIEGRAAAFGRRCRGVDYDDLKAAALYGFVQAYHSFDPAKSSFTTWVSKKITGRMKDVLRKRRRDAEKAGNGFVMDDLPSSPGRVFDLEGWYDTLSEDAAFMARLVFDTPPDIQLFVGRMKVDTVEVFRAAMRDYLHDRGWGMVRIKAAFGEIRRKL